MYFWDSRRLAVDLRNDAVPASTLRNYLIALLLVSTPAMYLIFPTPPDIWSVISLFGGIAIIIIGIRYAYQANGGDEGQRFIEKSVALLLPLTIQSMALGFALALSWHVFRPSSLGRLSTDGTGLIDSTSQNLFWLALQVWLLWRLVVHLRDMRAADVDAPPDLNAPAPEAAPHR